MNLRTLAVPLLLSASALALAPPASAAEAAANPCLLPETELDGGVLFGVRVDYDPTTQTCHYWVGLIDAYRLCGNIAGFEHQQLREDVTFSGATGLPRTVHVVVNYCTPDLDITCTCDPIVTPVDLGDLVAASSADLQPPIYCIREPCGPSPPPVAISWCKVENATPAEVPHTTLRPRETVWGTDEGCDIDAESAWSCAPPSGFWVERTVGPVHVKILVCDGGITTGPIVQAIKDLIALQ